MHVGSASELNVKTLNDNAIACAKMANKNYQNKLAFVDDLVVSHTLRVIYIRTFTLQTPTLKPYLRSRLCVVVSRA